MKPRTLLLLALVFASSAAVYVRRASPPDPRAREPEREQVQVETWRPVTTRAPMAPAALVAVSPGHAAERSEPHPITGARAALAEQNALFLALEGALKARDVGLARRLLRQHAERFPDVEGGAEDRDGFGAIADCIESPGAESRANAERFIAEHRASPLRRRVRHACLGPRAPILLR